LEKYRRRWRFDQCRHGLYKQTTLSIAEDRSTNSIAGLSNQRRAWHPSKKLITERVLFEEVKKPAMARKNGML
jgi:hypothetical protein